MLIYLAMPIDRNQDFLEQYANICRMLNKECPGVVVYTPGSAFSGVAMDANTAHQIIATNYAAIDHADVVLVVYRHGIETWGTSQEVKYAYDAHKNLALITPDFVGKWEDLPLYLRAYIYGTHWLTWESLIKELNSVEDLFNNA